MFPVVATLVPALAAPPAHIAAYDAIHEHILGMADALSTGVISQFSQRFN